MSAPIAKRGKGQRRRVTENAPASRIAEAEAIWHSTAINDSSAFAENIPPDEDNDNTPARRKEKNRALETVQEEKDSGRGGSTSRDYEPGQRCSSPVVINPPSGHSFFSSVLQRCGYIIKQPHASNQMYHDVMKFRMELASWLTENDDEMRRIETETSKFINALKAYLSLKPNFALALKPTKHETELIQPCLLSCLLGVDKLQDEILKIAMNILAEASFSSDEEEVSLLSTTLERLKWQSYDNTDATKLCDNLITFLGPASVMCQTHIVRTLPDILPTRVHAYAADKLLEKFGDNCIQLNVALMDCFSSMDIPGDRWTTIRYTAIDQMVNAPFRDIPSYISFLFLSESKDCLNEVISNMREKVQLNPEHNHSKNDAFQSEILEKIGFCATVNPALANVWIKLVKDDIQNGMMENIKKIDMLMLFLFSESHKSAVSVLKLIFGEKKVAKDLFTLMLLKNTMMVYQLFPQICKILESLLRSRVSKCLETVSEIIIELFLGLGDIEAQTLIGNLTGILINCFPARETVLNILTKLAEVKADKLLGFAPYLMGVLDYVQEFPAGQIQSLMNILAILSQTESNAPGGVNSFNSEFSILLRKQLTQRDLKIRCFGIMGALATVRHMAKQPTPEYTRMNELLKLAWSFVERDEDACGIFLDELGVSAKSLPPQICLHFCNILRHKFQTLWTIDQRKKDLISQLSQRSPVKLVPAFDANKECAADRVIITFESKPMEMKPIIIPAHLHVLTTLERKIEKNLVALDAILGCPILFPSLDDYYKVDSIKDFTFDRQRRLGEYLVLAINFFRECVSAYVKDTDPELRIKIWVRLESIVELQKYLVKHFDNFPQLPVAYASDKTIGSSYKDGPGPSGLSGGFKAPKPVPKTNETKKGKGIKKGGKSKKARRESSGSSDEENDNFQTNTNTAFGNSRREKPILVNLEETIQPKQVLPYLRRFSQGVFEILLQKGIRFDAEHVSFSNLLMNLTTVSQNCTEVMRVEKFTPDTLTLVLTDLKSQISDTRVALNVLEVKKLLKSVCKHINDIYGFLQKNEEDEELVISAEQQSKWEGCLRLLIGIMNSYLEAVKKLDKEERIQTTSKAVAVLCRLAGPSQDHDEMSSQAEVMAKVGSYFSGLVSVIKNPRTALDHLKMLKTLHDLLDGHAQIKKAIDESSQMYLRNAWKLSSSHVDGILKIWFATTPTPIKTINDISQKLLEDDEGGNEKIPITKVYKACSDTNFHTWYAGMMSTLSQYVYKKLRRRGEFEENIQDWIIAVEIFNRLVNATSKTQKQLILSALLKNCRMFLDSFISGGTELLPHYFRENSQAAGSFCKKLQVPCRKILHICEHAKKTGDSQLLKFTPLVRRVIETFVWKVREILVACGAPDAFEIGVLKHRDLEGKVIDSQIYHDDEMPDFSSDDSDDGDDDAPQVGLRALNEIVDLDEDSDDAVDVPSSSRSRRQEPVENEDSMDLDY